MTCFLCLSYGATDKFTCANHRTIECFPGSGIHGKLQSTMYRWHKIYVLNYPHKRLTLLACDKLTQVLFPSAYRASANNSPPPSQLHQTASCHSTLDPRWGFVIPYGVHSFLLLICPENKVDPTNQQASSSECKKLYTMS